MEDSKRLFKFHGNPSRDFNDWVSRTEAAIAAKQLLHVFLTTFYSSTFHISSSEDVRESDVPSDSVTPLQKAQARATIFKVLRYQPLMLHITERNEPN